MLPPLFLAAAVAAAPAPHWWQLPPLPDPHGFAGAFAGELRGTLLVAGGANFPERQLWEGGAKRWHDRIFVLEPGAAAWRLAGRLDLPLAHGVSAPDDGGLILAGGGDALRHHAAVFQLDWREGRLHRSELPPLPRPVAFSAGGRVGDRLLVVGGLAEPGAKESLNETFVLDLKARDRGWRRLPPWPGPGRHLAVAAVADGALFLFSGLTFTPDGAGGHRLEYLRDAYRLDPGRELWERLPDLPVAAAAAASPAPVGGSEIHVIGGVDGTLAGRPPSEFHPVPRRVQVYDTRGRRWREAAPAPMARVAVATIRSGERWILPSGESSAGVRSPEVWSLAWPAEAAPPPAR